MQRENNQTIIDDKWFDSRNYAAEECSAAPLCRQIIYDRSLNAKDNI